jgi:hypothetical protein
MATKSTSKKGTTTVATVNTTSLVIPKNSQEVSVTIEQLKTQLAILKGDREDSISLDISYDNGDNIKNVTTVGRLLEISSALHTRNDSYNREVERYGLQDKNIAPFKVANKTVSEWEKIIDKAIHELINKVKIEKIESAIKNLSKHLSEEERLANDLKSIAESVTEYIQ